VRSGDTAGDVAILKKIGIVDRSGKLTKKYKSWGAKVSRTEPIDDAAE